MSHIATITSKKQLTLPAALFRKLNFEVGQKVIVSHVENGLFITHARSIVEDLAGTLAMPKKWKNKSADEIIEQSKKNYFQTKKK